MKKIHLHTRDNSRFRCHLEEAGLSVFEKELPPSSFPEDALSIIEVDHTTIPLLKITLGEKDSLPPILCLAEEMNDPLRCELISLGISDFLAAPGGALLARYASMLCRPEEQNNQGLFLALENDGSYARLLQTISARFGYSTRFVETIDALLAEISHQPVELTLINLGARGFDITEFIKKTYSSASIKKYPLLAFKDMNDGLFVHEITSGLNRLTRQVLSREELLTFLINLLFRAVSQGMAMETKALLTDENLSGVACPSLRQVFFSAGAELCEKTDLFLNPRFSRARSVIASLDSLLLKTEGFRWMIPPKKKRVTCGGGV